MCRDSTQILFGVCLIAACVFGYSSGTGAQPANCLGSPADPHGKGGLLFYCQQVFDAASAAEAEDFARTPAADPSGANDKG
jgi:hypothetical protein